MNNRNFILSEKGEPIYVGEMTNMTTTKNIAESKVEPRPLSPTFAVIVGGVLMIVGVIFDEGFAFVAGAIYLAAGHLTVIAANNTEKIIAAIKEKK